MIWLWSLLWACRPEEEAQEEPTLPDEPSEVDTSDPRNDRRWGDLTSMIEGRMEQDAIPGMQVAVVIEGELRYAGSFGVRTWGTERKVTDETRFRWASVSKMHTAAAALQLVEQGLVDLDAPVTDTLPSWRLADGYDTSSVTLRHLLTHTSGLPDTLDWSCPTVGTGLIDTLQGWELPLHAPPGSFYNYSNTGYSVAGAMIEELTGQPFTEAIRERVLDPSGMDGATFETSEAIDGPHADGTTFRNDEPFVYPLEDWDCAISRPAAWLHGTASDLAQTAVWQLSEDGGGLLSPDTIDEMHDQFDTGYWSDERYRVGMGQFTEVDYHGERLVLHDGWVTGFTSMWIVAPERGFGVAIVANADWADTWSLAYTAADLFLGLAPEQSPSDLTDPSTWTRFEGTYYEPYTYGQIDVELRGDTLWAEAPELPASAQLIQVGASYFYTTLGGAGMDVRFVEDDSGTVRWFVSRYAVGTRSDAPLARKTRTWTPAPAYPHVTASKRPW